MARYKTRANEVNAVQVSVDNAKALKELMGDKGDLRPYLEHEFAAVFVSHNDSVQVATAGDFVYSDIDGLHKSSEEAFNACFEPVEEAKAN